MFWPAHYTSVIPAIRVFILTAFLWLSIFTFCKFTLWRDPHSAFFSSDRVYDFGYSELRRDQAVRFVQAANDFDHGSLQNPIGQTRPIMCAAFVTVKRKETQYFEESIGSMLEGLSVQERDSLHLYTLFADTDPSKHPSWRQPWLGRLLDGFESYNTTEENMKRMKEAEENHDYHVKGLFDYRYALEKCLSDTAAPYIAIFEDDVIFAEGWMARTLRALSDIKRGKPIRTTTGTPISPADRWLYLRLFFTETALRWRHEDFWFRHLPALVFLASCSGAAMLFCVRHQCARSRDHLTKTSIAVVCIVTIPAFIVLSFMVGKYGLFPLRGVVEMNSHGCCSQGMIYPRSEARPLLRFLAERGKGQTDTMVEEYADEQRLNRLALAPQVLQHVGRHSSRDNDGVTTKSTWAFWFETNDRLALEKGHRQDLKGIAWSALRSS
jgi:hypothetical protein